MRGIVTIDAMENDGEALDLHGTAEERVDKLSGLTVSNGAAGK